MDNPTSTARWSLVIHRVGRTSAEVWVGTLFPDLKKPVRARVRLFGENGGEARELESRIIGQQDWQRPFRKIGKRFFFIADFQDLEPGERYRVEFERQVEANPDIEITEHWQRLRSGRFCTLPDRLPLQGSKDAFTIALGSCFYEHRDGGRAAAAYKALYERGDPSVQPDIAVLSGDQVYLDIGFDSLSTVTSEIRERIASDYAHHWRALGSILSRGGTWMLPDDHEYWNDYPFWKSPIPQLLALRLNSVRESWANAALDAVKNIQRSPVVESFMLGDDLSVCFADLRSYRSEDKLLPDADFQKLLRWASRRSCPAVLVIPQPLIVEENKVERNLRSYRGQYAELLGALGSVSHDIVVLSGDVHFGRIARVPIGTNGARLIEIISSPLSNLTYLNGIATNVATDEPPEFPHSEAASDLGWPRCKIDYFKDEPGKGRFFVQSQKGRFLSAYPRDRTREHFMTVSFCLRPQGDVELTANAWLVRERTGRKHLPARSFAKPFRVILK